MKIVGVWFLISMFALVSFMEAQTRFIVLVVLVVVLLLSLLRLVFLKPKKPHADETAEIMWRRTRKGYMQVHYILIAIVLLSSLSQFNPLRRQHWDIRDFVLESTPLGMSMTDVEDYINSHRRWSDVDPDFRVEHYHLVAEFDDYDSVHNQIADNIAAGGQSISTRLGAVRYFFLFRYEVQATWLFDADGSLSDVVVSKGFYGRR